MSGGSVVGGQLQQDWFLRINDFARATPWLHTPLRLYADYGVVLFGALLLMSWWLARSSSDTRRVTAAIWAPLGMLLAVGINQFIGAAFAEPRPYAVLPHVQVLVAHTSDPSFPSDHAVMAGAVAVGVLLANRLLGLVAVVLAVLMAFTRVYVGAHFPLDVVAGVAVGGAVTWTSYAVVSRPLCRLVESLSCTRMHPLLLASVDRSGR